MTMRAEQRGLTPVGQGALAIVWVSAAMAVAGFFLPWASVNGALPEISKRLAQDESTDRALKTLSQIKLTVTRGGRTVSGMLPNLADMPTQVSGFEIPRLAHQEDVAVALALSELVTGQRALGMKTYAVYALPGLVLLGAVVATVWSHRWRIVGVVGVAALALAGAGTWKLVTTPTNRLIVAISFEIGLWLSIVAYALLGLAAALLAWQMKPSTSE